MKFLLAFILFFSVFSVFSQVDTPFGLKLGRRNKGFTQSSKITAPTPYKSFKEVTLVVGARGILYSIIAEVELPEDEAEKLYSDLLSSIPKDFRAHLDTGFVSEHSAYFISDRQKFSLLRVSNFGKRVSFKIAFEEKK